MEVTVKNCVLACNIQGNDTVSFYILNTQDNMSFTQIFKGASKPPGSKISMTWSSDGNYLALGSGNIQLWQLKQNRIRPLKTYNQDFIQIKQIEWTVDNLSYCIGGINRNNIIRIRNIQTGKIKQIKLPENQTMSSVSFDPFGKYLFILLRNNHLEIYNTINYQKQKIINLSPVNVKINPIREIRSGGWSPDYGNFVIPSLDDSRINIAFNLSRKYDFQIRNVYMGHCSAISCCKFNPKLYKYNSDITKIFSMGDSSGNISVWRIGLTTSYPQPLLLSSSMQNSQQVVQQIQWDQTGQLLIINMMKKYINLIKFNKIKDFGIQLKSEEVFNLIQEMYGSARAEDINAKQIEVFSGCLWKDEEEDKKKVNNSVIDEQNNAKDLVVDKEVRNNLNNINNNTINLQNKMQLQIHNEPIKQIQTQQIKPLQQQQQNIPILTTQMIPQQHQPINLNSNLIPSSSQPINPLNRYSLSSSTPQFIKLSEQKTIITKDNKKRIQPAMMVRKNQITTVSNANMNMNINSNIAQNNMNMMSTMYTNTNNLPIKNSPLFSPITLLQTMPRLSLKPISFTQKYLPLPNSHYLQLKKSSKLTLLQLSSSSHSIISHRYFPNNIEHIQLSNKYIYIINQQNLYIFDHELNAVELPLKVGLVHKISVDYYKDLVYYVTCSGYMIGVDLQRQVALTPAPVPVHLLIGALSSSNTPNNNSNTPHTNTTTNKPNLSLPQQISSISSQDIFIRELTISQDENVYISIGNNNNEKIHQSYLYNKKINGWAKLEYKQGKLTPGYSIRISQDQEIISRNIIRSLSTVLRNKQYEDKNMMNSMNNMIMMNNMSMMNSMNNMSMMNSMNNKPPTSSILSQSQQSLIYYSKHSFNQQKHSQSLLTHLKHLKQSNSSQQLRSQIFQYFFNPSSNNYIKNKQRRQKLFEKVKKYRR